MNISQYRTVCAPSTATLDASVTEMLSAGWRPQGGPYVWENQICQAMVSSQPALQPPRVNPNQSEIDGSGIGNPPASDQDFNP